MPIIYYISKGQSYQYTGKVETDALENWVNDREYELISKDLVKKIPKVASFIDKIVFWVINKMTGGSAKSENA